MQGKESMPGGFSRRNAATCCMRYGRTLAMTIRSSRTAVVSGGGMRPVDDESQLAHGAIQAFRLSRKFLAGSGRFFGARRIALHDLIELGHGRADLVDP